MQAIKGKSSHHLLQGHRSLWAEYWGGHLWARGYFVATSGYVTDETIAECFHFGRSSAGFDGKKLNGLIWN